MKYVISESKDDKKLMYYNVNVSGLDVKPINEVPNQVLKVGNITLVDEYLQDSYIKQRINKKLDKIIKFMLRILNDEDTSEDDTGMVLDEINRLKGIVVNKYRDYMKDSEYKTLLTKLILIEEEFKRNYNAKMYKSYLNSDYYEEEITTSRGK